MFTEPVQNQTNRVFLKKKTVFIFLLVLAAIVVVIVLKKQAGFSAQDLAKRNIPSYLVLSDAKRLAAFKTADTKDFRLLEKESLSEGVSYVAQKPFAQTAKELYNQRSQQGWVAIAGSFSTENMVVIKMNNGKETVFIKLIKQSTGDSETTQVIILPVKR
jgi:hypothetical protein